MEILGFLFFMSVAVGFPLALDCITNILIRGFDFKNWKLYFLKGEC